MHIPFLGQKVHYPQGGEGGRFQVPPPPAAAGVSPATIVPQVSPVMAIFSSSLSGPHRSITTPQDGKVVGGAPAHQQLSQKKPSTSPTPVVPSLWGGGGRRV